MTALRGHRRLPWLLWTAAAAWPALQACSAWSPPPAAPATVEVPTAWAEAEAAGGGAVGIDGASLTSWWRRFDDPVLADLVQRALQANTDVNGAQAALRQAQALRDVAAAALRPTLDATASVQHGTAGGRSTGNVFQLGLDAHWVPDVFGARRAARDAADAAALASAAGLGDVQVQVAAEVALDYIVLRATEAREAIAIDNQDSLQQTLQITQWRRQAGLATALDTQQALAAVEQNRALLPALHVGIVQTRHALALLCGLAPAALPAAAASPAAGHPVPRAADAPVPTIPAETLRQRADVRAAEHQVAAAWARIGQAQAQRWPTFSIGGTLGWSAATLGALTGGTSTVGSLLAGVDLPLFDGGAARAQVRVQQAALEQAQQQYRATLLGALRDVEDALVALGGDRRRLASLLAAADAASQAALLARQRYGSGLVDFQVVLDTQRTRFATLDGVIGASADVGGDQVRLFKALGGGWRDE